MEYRPKRLLKNNKEDFLNNFWNYGNGSLENIR